MGPRARGQVGASPFEPSPAEPAATAPAATQPGAESLPQITSTPEEFVSFGVKLAVPPQWKRLNEGRSNVVGRWALLKEGSTEAVSTIVTVELEPARGRT